MDIQHNIRAILDCNLPVICPETKLIIEAKILQTLGIDKDGCLLGY